MLEWAPANIHPMAQKWKAFAGKQEIGSNTPLDDGGLKSEFPNPRARALWWEGPPYLSYLPAGTCIPGQHYSAADENEIQIVCKCQKLQLYSYEGII